VNDLFLVRFVGEAIRDLGLWNPSIPSKDEKANEIKEGKEITIGGDRYFYTNGLFKCVENRFEEEECLEKTSLKTMMEMEISSHLDSNGEKENNVLCKTIVRKENLCKEQLKVAYVISQCLAIYCLKMCRGL